MTPETPPILRLSPFLPALPFLKEPLSNCFAPLSDPPPFFS